MSELTPVVTPAAIVAHCEFKRILYERAVVMLYRSHVAQVLNVTVNEATKVVEVEYYDATNPSYGVQKVTIAYDRFFSIQELRTDKIDNLCKD